MTRFSLSALLACSPVSQSRAILKARPAVLAYRRNTGKVRSPDHRLSSLCIVSFRGRSGGLLIAGPTRMGGKAGSIRFAPFQRIDLKCQKFFTSLTGPLVLSPSYTRTYDYRLPLCTLVSRCAQSRLVSITDHAMVAT